MSEGLPDPRVVGHQYRKIARVWAVEMTREFTVNMPEGAMTGQAGDYWRCRMDTKQVILRPKGEHSEKPAEVRGRIVALCGDVPRIELFARQRAVGWDVWGLEVPAGTQLTMEAIQ